LVDAVLEFGARRSAEDGVLIDVEAPPLAL